MESRLERKEGEAARERELAHAREKLVRYQLNLPLFSLFDITIVSIQGSGGTAGETKRASDRSK